MEAGHRLLQLGDYIVDSRIVETCFSCDLSVCGGACCLEGDSGAPLEDEEVLALESCLPALLPQLSIGSCRALRKGVAYKDSSGEWVTRLVDGAECAFATQREGCFLCQVELSYGLGEISVEKPISCSLYPIRVGRTGPFTLLRYDVWGVCDGARKLGALRGVRVYEFLRRSLERAFGHIFYQQLDQARRSLSE